MWSAARRWVAGGMALCLLGAAQACGDGPEAGGSGPVVVEMWGWDPKYAKVADKFNATHDKIQVKYVKQADNPTTATNLRNVVKSGDGVPCLVQNFGELPGLLGEGLLADITDQLKPHVDEKKFKDSAVAAAEIQGRFHGIPTGAEPAYMIINRKVYDQYGISVPKTWDDVIAAGKALKPHGIQVMNLAGEDPSLLEQLVQLAGGTWYSVEGDSWKVSFTSAESKKAAAVLQQLVDDDLVANQTYQDRPALIAYFDEGRMVSLPTNVWQLGNYQNNFTKTLGQWEPIALPQYRDAAKYTTPAHSKPMIVAKGCPTLAEATEVGVWWSTSKDAIDASFDEKTGTYSWPGAVEDPSPWAESAVPQKLFGAYASQAVDVWLKAAAAGVDTWVVGPNYTAVFKELQDQWAKAVTKQITFEQLLENMQRFTVDDLKTQGINVAGS
ncbi:ABC transporter substrate-binding protein [Saccharothrix deserti]|uniref:ABC transporter substrate-binding protein n=1 Tax=Saccharothrix deserti TaxID=2593674 RepID=UPI00131C9F42|nr:extracellular solute-binding protein [Saccharothrix deserti]